MCQLPLARGHELAIAQKKWKCNAHLICVLERAIGAASKICVEIIVVGQKKS